MPPVGARRKKHLVQTVVDEPVLRKLDALAKATGHKRAGYLRHLIEMHVEALTPQMARTFAMSRSQQIGPCNGGLVFGKRA